jgi:hypothetical protein
MLFLVAIRQSRFHFDHLIATKIDFSPKINELKYILVATTFDHFIMTKIDLSHLKVIKLILGENTIKGAILLLV